VLLLEAAQSGCLSAREEIFFSLCERIAKAHMKKAYTELAGEVFLCFVEALEKYNSSLKPAGKQHVFWFSRYFKHRLRFCMQTYRRHTQYPVTLSAHALRSGVSISFTEISESLC